MTGADPTRTFRVAIRAEGAMVNAYWARTGTMEGAELIASISRELCDADTRAFEAFRALMAAAGVTMAQVRLHANVRTVEIEPAPEHERSGHS